MNKKDLNKLLNTLGQLQPTSHDPGTPNENCGCEFNDLFSSSPMNYMCSLVKKCIEGGGDLSLETTSLCDRNCHGTCSTRVSCVGSTADFDILVDGRCINPSEETETKR